MSLSTDDKTFDVCKTSDGKTFDDNTMTDDAKKAPKRHWHRRPGQKIDDLLLKRHLRYAPLTLLLNQSEQRKSLTQTVRALLPEALIGAVSVVNYRPPTLILRVSNASLATRLRYQLPTLTNKLRNLADFDGLSKINLRVVQTIPPKAQEKATRYLPPAAATSLDEFARTLEEQPDYLELQKTILRLSKHKAPIPEAVLVGKHGNDKGPDRETK